MTIKESVEKIQGLSTAWLAGLGALRAQDRKHIIAQDTRRITGSFDLDSNVKAIYPNDNRWDFAIGFSHSNCKDEWIYWIEIHSASDGEIAVVGRKFDWLKQWLSGAGQPLKGFNSDFLWLSSGSTSFTQRSPQLRQLSQKGLRYGGKILNIKSYRP